MEISVWSAFVGLSFIYCLVPGPSVCFTIAHSIQHGISRTNVTIIGQITGNTVYIMLVCFGLGRLMENSIEIFYAVKYIGAAYIVYLGIRQIFSRGFDLEFDADLRQKSTIKSFFDGFVICGTNPKTFFYYASFLPQFIIPHYDRQIQLIALGVGSMAIAFISLALYNIAGKKAKDLLMGKRYFHHCHFVIGSLFILAGFFLGFL
jgi:homoserine/homoserine lactone efflux protein